MEVNLSLVATTAALVGCGVYLMLERSLTRVLIGLVLLSNGVNLMFMIASGRAGLSPLVGVSDSDEMADPLPQALVLTAIVITLGTIAFLLAMAHRSWQLHGHDDVQDDTEDAAIRKLALDDATSDSYDLTTGRQDDEGPGEEAAVAKEEGLMSMTALVPLPVLLPLLGAGAALMLSRRPHAQRTVTFVVLAAIVVLSGFLLFAADQHGPQVVWLGGWHELGIALVADRLAALMLLVSSLVTLAVLAYSIGQGMTGDEDDEEETPVSIYHPTFLVLVAGVSNAFLAGDLFNLFVSFEMLLFASYVLLTLGGTGARVRAGTIYVVVNVTSSMLFLLALAATYAAVGTLNMAQVAVRVAELPDHVALQLQLLLLVTFSIKAAVFPLSLWLPDSYPTAPAPVTAVFAGLLTKVGVYAIIRLQTLIFPDSALSSLLMWAALATMVIGILGSVAQSDIKRMLSFTLVSHIGYMIFGVALATEAGLSGAIFYVAHHITIQTALFLVLGLIERRAGSTALLRLGGLARLAPLLGVLFFIPAMNLAGIPPLSGFLGKVGLFNAGLADGSWLAITLVVGGTLTSLLTLYAVAKTWTLAFWRSPEQAHEMMRLLPSSSDPQSGDVPQPHIVRHRDHVHVGSVAFGKHDVADARRVVDSDAPEQDLHQLLQENALPSRLPASMVGPAAALVVVSIAITFLAGPLFAFTDRAAADLTERTPYLSAVFEEPE